MGDDGVDGVGGVRHISTHGDTCNHYHVVGVEVPSENVVCISELIGFDT